MYGAALGPPGAGMGTQGSVGASVSWKTGLRQAFGIPTLRDLLSQSSFFYSSNGERLPGGLTAWSRTAVTRFQGMDGSMVLSGEVATSTLGVDLERDRWLTGLVLAHDRGADGYDSVEAADGDVRSTTLTSLHPFVRYRLNDRTRSNCILICEAIRIHNVKRT